MTTYSDDDVQVIGPKQTYGDDDVQVSGPADAPAPAPAPAAPQDTRPVSQTLGFAKQVAQRLSTISDRIETDPNIKPWVDALDAAIPGIDAARAALKGPIKQGLLPATQQAEQRYRPGGIGKTAADLAVGTGAMLTLPETGPLGLLGSGAAAGAATSDAPVGDTKGLLKDMGIGALTNRIATPVIGKALSAVGDAGANMVAKATAKIPKAAELRQAASDMYDKLHSMGVTYAPHALGDLADKIQGATTDIPGNVDPEVNKSVLSVLTNNVLPRLRDSAESGVGMSLKELDKMRQGVYDKIGDPAANTKDNRRLAWTIMNHMNDFVNTATDDMIHVPGDMAAGAAQKAAVELQQAKQLFSRSAKTQQIEDIIKSAQLRAASAFSGGNINNTIRQRLRPLVDPTSPKVLRGATPEETAQINSVVKGTPVGNAARVVGAAAPSRGGLSLIGTAIAGHLNPMLLAGSALAQGAKGIADSSTERGVQKLLNMVASGGSDGVLAARQLQSLAVRNSQVAGWLKAAGLDLSEQSRVGGIGALTQGRAGAQLDADRQRQAAQGAR